MESSKELPRFDNPDGADDRFGFYDRSRGHYLPGQTWESGNMFNDTTFMPNCNMEDGVFNDTVWGMGYDGRLSLSSEAPVLTDIFFSNAVRRLQAVEQLTLPPEYSTIPNTAAFSRFEHIWGSVLFVKQFAKQQGIETEKLVDYQLRTLLSDLAHTTGSHMGDWLFQGVGQAEDQHDIELKNYLETVGITKILRTHDIDPDSVIFPEVTDWVEAPSPDLCVDRVDYGLREMNRWNDTIRSQVFNVKDFTLTPENALAMTDQRRARIFAEGYLLLSEEHWSEPTHRFLEEMMILRTKLFYAEYGAPGTWVFSEPGQANALLPLHEMHPRDLMYVTDPTQLLSLARHSLGGNTLDSIMRTIAQYRRQYVWPGKRERIAQYMQQFADQEKYHKILKSGMHTALEDAKFSSYLSEYPAYIPIGFTILNEKETIESASEEAIDFVQQPFKIRQVDPLVQAGSKFVRLSKLDESFAQRLIQHRSRLEQTHVARLAIPDPKARQMIRAIIDNVESHWQNRLSTSRRMTASELKRLVDNSASEIHGRYPFLSFLNY